MIQIDLIVGVDFFVGIEFTKTVIDHVPVTNSPFKVRKTEFIGYHHHLCEFFLQFSEKFQISDTII